MEGRDWRIEAFASFFSSVVALNRAKITHMTIPGIDPPDNYNDRKPQVRLSPDPFKASFLIVPIMISALVIIIGWLLLQFFLIPRIFG